LLREPVGLQDQISAAFGGFNHIVFRQDGGYDVKPIILPKAKLEALQDHLLLFFTGVSRLSTDVAQTVIANLNARAQELRTLQGMVGEAMSILASPSADFAELGALLHESWQLKRSLSDRVSNAMIDDVYAAARRAGAIGGKILGAGGGGFMLMFVRPEHRAAVREALKGLIAVPFRFESSGCRIVLYQPDGL
jgi:D-glycero-alpha-D-manno-heptose-7-phosphate kinase